MFWSTSFLYHAIAVGSIGETLKGRKIVISVSPQWFKNTGVKEDAFGATYSESNFIEFLKISHGFLLLYLYHLTSSFILLHIVGLFFVRSMALLIT